MRRQDKIKVCYILPKFDLETDTHYLHLFDFINSAAKELNMSLIIESCRSNVDFFNNVNSVIVQRFKWTPIRIIENFFLVLIQRFKGYKKFYVHYTYIGAVNAGLITRLFGGSTWYWHCGMVWLYGKHRLLKIVLHIVQFHVTGNQTMKKEYAKYFSIPLKKIVVMPNWVDKKRFTETDNEIILKKYNLKKKSYVLFVHHLSKRKGAHHLVPTAVNFMDDKNVEFLVAGDGPYRKEIEQEIKEAKINNLRLLGRVPNRDVPGLLKIASVFFMPSEEEGFPRVIIEAMMSGTPYVAADIGGTKEISSPEQHRFICRVGDIDCFTRSLRELLTDENTAEKLVQVNKEWVKQYEKEVVLKKFLNIFSA